MQCRKGPNAARKGHMATPAGLDLSKAGRAAGPKNLGLSSGQSSDRAGVWDSLKGSKPAIMLLQMVQASPRLPKREFPRLKPPKHATHELAGGVWDSRQGQQGGTAGTADRDRRQGQQAGTAATGTAGRDAWTEHGLNKDRARTQ